MAGAQFKQNAREVVKFGRWEITESMGYSERSRPMCEPHTVHTMTRFSQPSFLRGAPRPLVLSTDSQGQHPLELYEKIASPVPALVPIESGKGRTTAPGYSFLGSGPVSIISVPGPVDRTIG